MVLTRNEWRSNRHESIPLSGTTDGQLQPPLAYWKRRTSMLRYRNSLMLAILFATLLPLAVSGSPDEGHGRRLSTPLGGVAFEVVGQVSNFPPAGAGQPATSQQYGYLSLINGLTADQI